MRLKAVFQCEPGVEDLVKSDYRRLFLSILKSISEDDDTLAPLVLGRGLVKPYTFSVLLKKDATMTLSTGNQRIFLKFLNAFIRNRNREFNVAGRILTLKSVTPLQVYEVSPSNYTILNVAIVTNPFENRHVWENYYITPSHKNFEEICLERIKQRYKLITGKDFNFDFRVYPISCREVPIKHYGYYMKAFTGIIRLEGDIEAIKFIYDYGLGVKTGQGFGLISEIGRQK